MTGRHGDNCIDMINKQEGALDLKLVDQLNAAMLRAHLSPGLHVRFSYYLSMETNFECRNEDHVYLLYNLNFDWNKIFSCKIWHIFLAKLPPL